MVWKMHVRQPIDDLIYEYSDICFENSFIALGWGQSGDLKGYRSKEVLRSEIATWEGWGDSNKSIGSVAGMLWRFHNEMSIGDQILCPDMIDEYWYFGRVTSGYYFEKEPIDECPFKHRREMNWLVGIPETEIHRIFGRTRIGGIQSLALLNITTKELNSIIDLVS